MVIVSDAKQSARISNIIVIPKYLTKSISYSDSVRMQLALHKCALQRRMSEHIKLCMKTDRVKIAENHQLRGKEKT